MSDDELDAIRRKRLLEFQRNLAAKKEKNEETNADEVLNRFFRGRAWEVFASANHQFPLIMTRVKELLVKMALSGKLKEMTGEQLFLFLRNIGLRVKLNTRINYVSHGQLKSLAEKMKEDLLKK